ncbi:MAG: phosphatidylserine/phosphatidylglycerophosphate/cardiolipin synthase family protein [Deltaproteobacteria bacterium]|nr:phosphatidylserine/phosphatidylglycerophosphate/cardiolipin synthase family protein [Deltaproteobacteria bacterium]
MQRATAHPIQLPPDGFRPLSWPKLHVVDPGQTHAHLELLAGGERAFREILNRVDQARERIEIRAFVWRDDETGNMLASALLRAADRGVRIDIRKDRVGANYEYYGGSHQSFFHKRINLTQRFETHFLHTVYPKPRGSFRQRPNVLAEALLAHPRVFVEHLKPLHDHSKLYIFDDSSLILGGMGVGDDHRKEWIDVMVAADSPELVSRLRRRIQGDVPFDAARRIDFLLHMRNTPAAQGCPLLGQRLALIDSAQRSLTVAMAYLGDARFGHALIRAAQRGVQVTLLTSSMSDFLGSLNRASCDQLLRATGSENVRIVMLPSPMVHAKATVVDGAIADVGSANYTPLSHGAFSEINLFIRDATFAQALEKTILDVAARGEQMMGRVRRNHLFEWIERAIVEKQARKGF